MIHFFVFTLPSYYTLHYLISHFVCSLDDKNNKENLVQANFNAYFASIVRKSFKYSKYEYQKSLKNYIEMKLALNY